MELQKNRIALISPAQNAFSETFIQAQKNGLKGRVFYYYGGSLPTHLEQQGKLLNPFIHRNNKIKKKLRLTSFNAGEEAFIFSLKRNKIQIVLAQYGTTANRIVAICKYLKIPLITHFHGYDASMFEVIRKCDNYQEVFQYSSSIIAVSLLMKRNLIVLGCPEEKITYNPYGPASSFLKIKPQYSKPSFIALGRFVDKKAPYYTILAFNKVVKKHPNAKLILGGNGPLFEVCFNMVKYFKMEGNVTFPGVLTSEQFADYLSTSLAFVQHSVTAISGDQEGTPVAVLEASAAGLPVISTNHAGIPDVILDSETGFLVNEHDVDAMAEKMLLVLGDIELAKRMGLKGKQRIQEKFNLERYLQSLDDLVECSLKK